MKEASGKQIYWKDATPEDFINIEQCDWIEGAGDVGTYYEVKFIRNFGHVLKAAMQSPTAAEQRIEEVIEELERLADACYKDIPGMEKRGAYKRAISLLRGDGKP